jgi:hypothetical protein
VGFEVELAGRKLFSSLLLAALVVFAGCLVAPTYAVRPPISSQWTSNPPTIDGRFTLGEWFNLQITVQGPSFPDNYTKPTFVYFMNDNSRLYVLVDASGDGTDDGLDECLLVFGFPPNNVDVEIIGASSTRVTVNFDAAVGFDSSPNNQTAHKIYEFSIPFSYINAQPGQSLVFSSPLSGKFGGSMPYDATTLHDNVWPVGLKEDGISTYDTLGIGSQPVAPVGGYMEPVNKLSIIAPYLALFGLAAALVYVAVKPWKKPEN